MRTEMEYIIERDPSKKLISFKYTLYRRHPNNHREYMGEYITQAGARRGAVQSALANRPVEVARFTL